MIRRSLVVFVCLGLVFCPLRVQAQNVYPLTLDEASRLALRNNFDIQLARYELAIAQTQQDQTESMFDTFLDGEVSYRNNRRQNTSSILGSKSLENDYNVSLSRKTPSGTTITTDLTNSRDWSNSAFATLNPAHDASLGLTLQQELGRNFFGRLDRGEVRLTKLSIARTRLDVLDKIEGALADVQKAYWDLALQTELVKTAQDMRDQARHLRDVVTEKRQHGLVEDPDVLAAEANARQRETQWRLTENARQTKAAVLRLLLNIDEEAGEIHPAPSENWFSEENLAVSLSAAFAQRYDYQRALKESEARDVELAMSRDQLWPQINLKASLARNGVDDHFSGAYHALTDEDHADFSAGLSVRMPLENRAARAQTRSAELGKARVVIALKQLERRIAVAVADQVRLCQVLQQQTMDLQDIAVLQQRKLAAEEKRFQGGRSAIDTIIRYQDDLSQAQAAAVSAKTAYLAAVIDLRRLEGGLLLKYGGDQFDLTLLSPREAQDP